MLLSTEVPPSPLRALVCSQYIILFSALLLAFVPTAVADELLSAEQLTERMVRMDSERTANLHSYAVIRRYVLDNARFHKHAEMTVRMDCDASGRKQFKVLSESGTALIRNKVFRRLLQTEQDGARAENRHETRITPQNYDFRLVGTETLEGRLSYVLDAAPKKPNKLLFRGRVWVDAEDAAVVRIEGSPAQNPSFWTTKVHFVHRFQKHGRFWLAASNHSETEVRIFGTTELKIEYSDYEVNPSGGQ